MTTTGDLETPDVTVPPAPPVAAPKKNVFQRIAGVLFAPAETFQEIARRPDIVGPLLIIIVISFISTIILVQRMDFETMMREQMSAQGQQPDEQALRIGTAFGKVMAYTSPLWGIIGFLVIAGVLLLAFRLFGGEGNFTQAFSVVLYAWVPMVIKSIVMGIVAFFQGTIDPATAAATLVKSNPAFLFDIKEQPVLFSFVSSFDVFTIWTLFLVIIGFAALAKVSRTKAAVIVLSLWSIWIVIKLGLAAMGAAATAGKRA